MEMMAEDRGSSSNDPVDNDEFFVQAVWIPSANVHEAPFEFQSTPQLSLGLSVARTVPPSPTDHPHPLPPIPCPMVPAQVRLNDSQTDLFSSSWEYNV